MVDYQQKAEDHQSLLVLVKHTGSHLPTRYAFVLLVSCVSFSANISIEIVVYQGEV
jgi:hypothetical protein